MKSMPCTQCVATKQMRESPYCTKTIVEIDGQFIPECFVKLAKLDQPERNYLSCQTYNLGLYQVCKTCPLSCPKNPTQKSPLEDLITLVAPLFGADKEKQEAVKQAVSKLNEPEFADIRNSLDAVSATIRNIVDGKPGAADVGKAKLEAESTKLKEKFDDLVKTGKITEAEANRIRSEIKNHDSIKMAREMMDEFRKK
jgi:hypothetical protein